MEVTYDPARPVIAGRYIVKLIPVDDADMPIGEGIVITDNAAPMAANPPPPSQNIAGAVAAAPGAAVEAAPGAAANPGDEGALGAEGEEDDYTNNSNPFIGSMPGGGKRKTKMNKKSKGMKKSKGTRKLSGYMKFAQEVRPQILKNNPSLKSDIIGVGRKIGEMWRGLSQQEKARY